MPRALADSFLQQTTVQPVVDEVALIVKGSAAGLTTDLTEWMTSGGTILVRVDQNGNFRTANTKGLYLDMASGNQGYVIGTAANQLDVRMGTGGMRILDSSGASARFTLTDGGTYTLSGNVTTTGTMTAPSLTSYIVPAQTNVVYTVPTGAAGTLLTYNPVSKYTWHDLLAFNRWWGAPTFETYTGTWAADTLNNGLWSGLENQAITVIDGTTKTAARWTWNSSNIAFCAVEWFLLGFTYAGATSSQKNILIETSVDGSAWTTRHTSTGNTANAQPVLAYAPVYTADTYLRLTITVTNGITLPMSSIRALSDRWGNQGGGSEYTFPYSWDATQRMAIGPAAVVANANLTVGTNTTVSTGGIYFGTDTPLYRSGANALSMTGMLIVAGAVTGSNFSGPATTVTSETTFGLSTAVGTSVFMARQDHSHGSPTNPVTAHEAAADPHGTNIPVQNAAPSSPTLNDLWVDADAPCGTNTDMLYIQSSAPSVSPGNPYLWIQTGMANDGFTFWVEDGS